MSEVVKIDKTRTTLWTGCLGAIDNVLYNPSVHKTFQHHKGECCFRSVLVVNMKDCVVLYYQIIIGKIEFFFKCTILVLGYMCND